MPLPSKRLDSASTAVVVHGHFITHTLTNTLSAPTAFWCTQANVTRLAIRMAFKDGKTNVILKIKRAVAMNSDSLVLSECSRRPGLRLSWCKERITALGAEEVLLVIGSLSQCRIVQRNKPFINDWRLTVITLRREVLTLKGTVNPEKRRSSKQQNIPRDNRDDSMPVRHAHTH